MGRWVVAAVVCLFVLGTCQLGTCQAAIAEDGPGETGGTAQWGTAQWGAADLRVAISASPAVAQPGQGLVYRVQVRNLGPGDAVLPVLAVRVPAEIKIVGVNVAGCRVGRDEVVCASPTDVIAGESGGVTITGVVRPRARGRLRAVASLTSDVADVNEADNTAEARTKVGRGTDLAVRLAPSTRSTRPGHWFAVDALVRNRGPRTVKDVHVFLEPDSVRYLSASGARCHGKHGYVGCSLPPIRAGATGRMRLVFRVSSTAGRPVGAHALVYSRDLGDRRPANNRARARIAIG